MVEPLQLEPDDVLAAVTAISSGSAAGIDGIRPLHLQDMIAGDTMESGRRLLGALAKLSNLMLAGGIPDFACGALYGASLCALEKKGGGIRPIAVGSSYRRLTAKAAARHATALLADLFRPKQLGVGVPGGCEAAVHAAREFVRWSSSSVTSPPQVLVKVDVANAYNSINRLSFLSQIREKCPAIYPLMRQAYGFPSPLFYGKTKIFSRTGLHQGDPLASLAFSLAINPIIRNITCPFNAWYLDDGTFGGEPQEVSRNLRELEQGFAQLD